MEPSDLRGKRYPLIPGFLRWLPVIDCACFSVICCLVQRKMVFVELESPKVGIEVILQKEDLDIGQG